MSDIPHARLIVAAVQAEIAALHPEAAQRLEEALEHMHRRPLSKPRAPVTSTLVDAEVAEDIRQFVRARPRTSIQAVAVMFRTNSGRVSEALQGDR